uniref:TraB domain-containing protein n=1 Tax=Parastrongyloides trichosuri TaxID=131310 RepID=A0A0N4ZBN9_PARTI
MNCSIEVDPNQNINAIDKLEFNKKSNNNFIYPSSTIKIPISTIPLKLINNFSPEILKFYKEGNIILVGTVHFSDQSKIDVRRVIRATVPDGVYVELCPNRRSVLSMNEEVIINNDKNTLELLLENIRKNGLTKGIVTAFFTTHSDEFLKKTKRRPGGEFRVAKKECSKIKNSIFGYCDRSIQVTLTRLYKSLSLWEKFKLFKDCIDSNIDDEMAEKLLTNSPAFLKIEEFLDMAYEKYPGIYKVMIEERDQYMATILLRNYNAIFEKKANEALTGGKDMEVVNIVAIVGYGHLIGIKNCFGKEYDLDELNSITLQNENVNMYKVCYQLSLFGGALIFGYYIFKQWK